MNRPPSVNVASQAWRRKVTLHDGREVDNDSEDWRAECEARRVLKMPTKDGRWEYLEAVARRRGRAASNALRDLVMHIWRSGRTTGQDKY